MPSKPQGRWPAGTGLMLLLLLVLTSCGAPREQGDPGAAKGPPPDGCLRDWSLKKLKAALRRCDAVVRHYPDDPQPRNERALLHSLAGHGPQSCADSLAAARLLRQRSAGASQDPLQAKEIRQREAACLTNPPITGAPSGAGPGAAAR